jgi:hypothetical protein
MFATNAETSAKPATMPEAAVIDPDQGAGHDERIHERHGTLMQCLRDERDLQAEERMQMSIDHDYYDHLQWREEDAAVLMARGQAPLVFNEARQTIDWLCGTQKRMRMDGTILPREPSDQQSAEIKTQVFKYVSDSNLAPWHVSRAYKAAVLSGLGWLEEGINTDPSKPLIFSGSEDWRNVYRDSRDLSFDLGDSRYQFRRKRTDLDYACELLPKARKHLIQHSDANEDGDQRGDDIWYLGERLTGATDLSGTGGFLPSRYRDRSAFIGGPQGIDQGRRRSVDLLECWYRVPEAVEVFRSGPLAGKVMDPKDVGHAQLKADRWAMYRAVVMRMRVMIATETAPLWDGKSPMRHQNFLLVPVWGYRRGRDGMAYGLMRGMRDLNDDINKRASKALHAASSNRLVVRRGALADLETARAEAARPDMLLEVENDVNDVRFEKPTADMKMNLDLFSLDREMLRNAGGVTDANLGRDSNATSGKAIGLQQDQGSLVTSELPDNLRLGCQLASRLRLSHIEQFMTEKQVIRITGEARPTQWVTINDQQEDGSFLNDIASKEADYVISERDYRETFAQAALEQMMELLGSIATYAPQVVMNVLDLVVDSADIKNKDEWVSRIRKLNGQRDPKKEPTPEEVAAAQEQDAKAKKAEQIQLDTLEATLNKIKSEVGKLDADAILKRVEGMFSALQAAQVVAMTPGVAPVADVISEGAGMVAQPGSMPALPTAAAMPEPATLPPDAAPIDPPVNPDTQQPPPAAAASATGLAGMNQGIETPAADSAPPMA